MKNKIKRVVSLVCIAAITLSLFSGVGLFNAFADVTYKDSYAVDFEEGSYQGATINQMPTNRYQFSTDYAHSGTTSLQSNGSKSDARFLLWDDDLTPVCLEQGVYYEVSMWYYVATETTTGCTFGFVAAPQGGAWSSGAAMISCTGYPTQISVEGNRNEGWKNIKGFVCIPESFNDDVVNLGVRFGTSGNTWIYVDDITVTKVDSSKKATITFNANGGSACDSITGTPVTRVTLPTSVKDGYIFDGWYSDAALTSPVSGFVPAVSTTYYAKWKIGGFESDLDYVLYRPLDPGYAGSDDDLNRTNATNMNYRWTYSDYPSNVSGFALAYDYQNAIDRFAQTSTDTSAYVPANISYRSSAFDRDSMNVTTRATLVNGANYEAVMRIFVESKGTAASTLQIAASSSTYSAANTKVQGSVNISDYQEGEWIEVSFRFTATCTSETLNYFYLLANGNDVFYVDNLRLYIVPSETISSTVTFNNNGVETVVSGNAGAALSYPDAGTMEGYTFGGWYINPECTVKFTRNTIPFENVKLYARWLISDKQNVSYDFVEDYSEFIGSNYVDSTHYDIEQAEETEVTDYEVSYPNSVVTDKNVIGENVAVTDEGLFYDTTTALAGGSSEILENETGIDLWEKWGALATSTGSAMLYSNGSAIAVEKGIKYNVTFNYFGQVNSSDLGCDICFGIAESDLSSSVTNVDGATYKLTSETNGTTQTVCITFVANADGYLAIGFDGMAALQLSNIIVKKIIVLNEISQIVYKNDTDDTTGHYFTLPSHDGSKTPLFIESDAKYIITFKYSAKNVGYNTALSLYSIENSAYADGMEAYSRVQLGKMIYIYQDCDETYVSFAFRTTAWKDRNLAICLNGQGTVAITAVEITALPDTYSIIDFSFSDYYFEPVYGLVGETVVPPDMSAYENFGGWFKDDNYFKAYDANPTFKVSYTVTSLYGYNNGKVNISFEQGYPIKGINGCISSEYWSIVDDPNLTHSGKSVAVYNSSSDNSRTRFGIMLAESDISRRDYKLLDGKPYLVSFWYNCVSTKTQGEYMGEVPNNISFYLQDTASATATSAASSQKVIDAVRNYGVTNGWVKVSVAFTAEIKANKRTSLVLKISGGSTVYVDDIEITPYEEGTNIVAFESSGSYVEPVISTESTTIDMPSVQKNGYEHDGWYTLKDEAVVLYTDADNTSSSYKSTKRATRPVETKYEGTTTTLGGTVTYHADWKPASLEQGFEDGITNEADKYYGDFALASVDAAFGTTSLKYSGKEAAAIEIANGKGFALENGAKYIAYAYVKAESSSVNFNFATTDANNITRSVVALTDGITVNASAGTNWKLVSIPFIYTSVSYDTTIVLTASGTGVATIDGIIIAKAPEVVVDSSITNGSVTVNEDDLTITVAPSEGYQLKVNSLTLAYSGDGKITNKAVFSKGDATAFGEGSGYVFSYLPQYGFTYDTVTVSAEFVKDTSFEVIASSIRNPYYGKTSGIRFRGRINTETEGMITVNGNEYEITSFGFMLLPQKILELMNIDPSDNSENGWVLDTIDKTSTVISDNTEYIYDKTGKFMDVQVLLYDMDKLVSFDITTKLYIKYIDENGEEQVTYSAPYSRSFNDVYSAIGQVGTRAEQKIDFEEYAEIVEDSKYVSSKYSVVADNVASGSAALKYSSTVSDLDFASLYDNTRVFKLKDNTAYNVTVNYKITEVETYGALALYAVCDGSVTSRGFTQLAEIAMVDSSSAGDYVTKTISFTTGELSNYNVLAIGSSGVMTIYVDDISIINDAVITFVSAHGEAISPLSQTVGTALTLPTPADESNEYTFDAWYTDSNYTTKYTETTFPSEDTVLYAKWTRNKFVQDFENYPTDKGNTAIYGTELKQNNPTVDGYDKAFVKSGSASFKKPVTTKNGAAFTILTSQMQGELVVGNTYLIKIWMYAETNAGGGEIIVRQNTGGAYGYNGEVGRFSLSTIPEDTWVMKTFEVTVNAGTKDFSIVHNNANSSVIYYDDIEIVGDYQLTWSDEFDGTGVNLDYWTYNRQLIPSYTQLSDGTVRRGITCRRNDNPNNTYIATGSEASNYVDLLNANFPSSYIGGTTETDGKFLVIRGLQQDINGNDNLSGTPLNPDDVYGFSSASIQTDNKVEYRYGYLEMRCMIPFGKGIWPAFWPCGASDLLKDPYGSEFDIFESNSSGLSFAANLHSSIDADGINAYHFNYLDYKSVMNSNFVEKGSGRAWYFNYGGTPGITSTNDFCLANYRQQFHTIGMEWTPEYISFACDGTKFFQVDITSPDWEAFHEMAQIKVSMSVGNVEGSLTNEETQWPAHFVIDYIRLYQRSGVGSLALN